MGEEDKKNENNYDAEEKLKRTWIGEKSQDYYIKKFKTGGFSVLAFLFPEIMLLGRKMWIESCLVIIAECIMLYFMNRSTPLITVIRIIMGAMYYLIYKASIDRKIKKYKKQGLSYEEQLEKAKKYGGDIFWIVITIFLVLYFCYFAHLKNANQSNEFNTIDNQNSVEDFYAANAEEMNYTSEIKLDNCTWKYNPQEWQEIKRIDDETTHKTIINDNYDKLIHAEDVIANGKIALPQYREYFANSYINEMEQYFSDEYGVDETFDWNVKKDNKEIYLWQFNSSIMKIFVLCRQKNENEVEMIFFNLVNVNNKEILPETVEKIEQMLFNIEFVDND